MCMPAAIAYNGCCQGISQTCVSGRCLSRWRVRHWPMPYHQPLHATVRDKPGCAGQPGLASEPRFSSHPQPWPTKRQAPNTSPAMLGTQTTAVSRGGVRRWARLWAEQGGSEGSAEARTSEPMRCRARRAPDRAQRRAHRLTPPRLTSIECDCPCPCPCGNAIQRTY